MRQTHRTHRTQGIIFADAHHTHTHQCRAATISGPHLKHGDDTLQARLTILQPQMSFHNVRGSSIANTQVRLVRPPLQGSRVPLGHRQVIPSVQDVIPKRDEVVQSASWKSTKMIPESLGASIALPTGTSIRPPREGNLSTSKHEGKPTLATAVATLQKASGAPIVRGSQVKQAESTVE